jgi:DNA (cytosine-5)-methyltransferase 1
VWLEYPAMAEQLVLPFPNKSTSLTTVELCAGAGGQALGLHSAGFQPLALVDDDRNCVVTLQENFKGANVYLEDLKTWKAKPFEGVDLLAAGLPCPPFSKAGKQLGSDDERNLFPVTLEIINEVKPRGITIENVPGLLEPRFEDFRSEFQEKLRKMGYTSTWKLLNACDYGVSQLRPRVVLVALEKDLASNFSWSHPLESTPPTVGEILYDLMAENGWKQVDEWKRKVVPILVQQELRKHGNL